MDHSEEYWEAKYDGGHAQRYPWDCVVTFVMRNAPKDRPHSEVSIVEIGCGTASNLWFAAREKFRVAGIEWSGAAVQYAKRRFASDGLSGDLRQGSFTSLPWPDNSFDLGIDRCSLTCVGDEDTQKALAELKRVLKPGARAFINPYADTHTSFLTGTRLPTGETVDSKAGTLAGIPTIRYWSRGDIDRFVAGAGWKILSIENIEARDLLNDTVHAEYRLVIEKPN